MPTQCGEVIGIFHQYAYTGKEKSIHLSLQLQAFKNDVNDKFIIVNCGLQCIIISNSNVIPLNIKSGLAYLTMGLFTDKEWDTMPHVIMTTDTDQEPSILDNDLDDNEEWSDAVPDLFDDPSSNHFDEFGDYRGCHLVNHLSADTDLDHRVIMAEDIFYAVHAHKNSSRNPYFESMRPYFSWLPTETIKKTYRCITQFTRMPMSTVLKKHYKSPFLTNIVHQYNEPIVTDTVYAGTPAIDSGFTCAQLSAGTKSLVSDIYGMKTDKQFVSTLEDIICGCGASHKLLSDSVQAEVSARVKDILRS